MVPTASLLLREATHADVPALCALVNTAYRGQPSRQGWTTEADLLSGQRTDAASLRRLLEEGCVFLTLGSARELSACVCLKRKDKGAYLGMLTVRPEVQGRGLGRRLLDLAQRWAKSHWNSSRLELTVLRQRGELMAWYERRGFHNTGRKEPFPYGDPRFGIPQVPDLEFAVFEKAL